MKKLLLLFFTFLHISLFAQYRESRAFSTIEIGVQIKHFLEYLPDDKFLINSNFQRLVNEQYEVSDEAPRIASLPEKNRFLLSSTFNYKRQLKSGNYFGGTAYWGRRKWETDRFVLFTLPLSDFVAYIEPIEEQNIERSLGVSYNFSFLLNRKAQNLLFFLGFGGEYYSNYSQVTYLHDEEVAPMERKESGLSSIVIPELNYFIPESPFYISFRMKTPLVHFIRGEEHFREAPPSIIDRENQIKMKEFVEYFPFRRSYFDLSIGFSFLVLR